MESKSMITKWVGALIGACFLLGAGVAQAALSVCSTITPAAPSVMLGSPSPSLKATCINSPGQYGYKWRVGAALLTSGSGATGTCTGDTCTIPATSLPAAGAYTVEVTNNNNDGTGLAKATATITVTPVPSDCLPTYGPVDFIAPQDPAAGQKVTLTANCNPGVKRSTTVDGYVWTAGGNPVVVAAQGAAAQAGEIINSSTGAAGPNTGPTITVAPPAEGTQYAVTNNTTVNSAKSPGAFYSGAPSCTLELVSPTEGAINSGASAVLLATCDAATSIDIDWYVDMASAPDINIPAPAGGAVSPAATTAYYVVGNNSYGSSGSNVVTVTVNQPAPALPDIPAPLCSLTASPLTISVDDSTTLTATCPGATSFTWTGSGAPATPTATSTIAVTPTSSGLKTYTVKGSIGNVTSSAAASVDVNVSALPTLACSRVAPANPVVVRGSNSPSLSATCEGTPASYVWKVGTTTLTYCTGATCTVLTGNIPNVGDYNVTVAAKNAAGTAGTTAGTVIKVSLLPTLACSRVAPANPVVVRGSNSPSLSATCEGTPASYVWKVGTTTLTYCTGATCTVLTGNIPNVGDYAVTVAAKNAAGTAGTTAGTVIKVSLLPTLACSRVAPANPVVVRGSNSPSLSATCDGTPASYVWKVGTTTLTYCTGATCTVLTGNIPNVGDYNVTVAAKNAAGTAGTEAGALITVGTATACPQSITEKPFDYATPGVTQHLTMSRGKAIAIKFTTDDLVKSGSVQTNQSTIGANVYKFMNLSKNKCDFSYTSINTDTRNGCGSTGVTTTVVRYTTGAPKAGTCTLQKNTTYYANIRNENALPSTTTYTTKRGVDTCPTGATCGFVSVLYGGVIP